MIVIKKIIIRVKKSHTVKTLLIVNKEKKIKYLSHGHCGAMHDYRILKERFIPQTNWFENHHIYVDLGFLGIAKDYLCKKLSIPHKKPPKKTLTDEQKLENQLMAIERIIVEHGIGGLKRFRVLSDKLRIYSLDLYDKIIGVCAGTWNFYLAN